MPTVWFSLKKSLHCKTEASDVHDPRITSKQRLSTISTRKSVRSGCSRSIANLKDVIHGSKRHLERPPSTCSPRSIGSSEFLNPITHEVILSNSTCELKISGYGGGGNEANGCSTFVGTLRPGTPGPGGQPAMHYFNHTNRNQAAHQRKTVSSLGGGGISSKPRVSVDKESNGSCVSISCHKCGEQFGKWEALEVHHLSKHAVTELVEGDSSRKIVEIICRSSGLKSESQCGRIERVLKVHNMPKTLARFEEYREMVKTKASKLPKKHPRCIADGNELLRFHGTTVACSLGINGSSSLIPLEKIQEIAGQTGFDSLAGKVGLYSNIEELYLLNPRALLPCFVVICKP
ncbi:hypothetical protein Leryth_005938 [Lithospermum erythrorhizon]|nr:hypothetical protein Leryth_005938 [Lithospermum erythrorhizon]